MQPTPFVAAILLAGGSVSVVASVKFVPTQPGAADGYPLGRANLYFYQHGYFPPETLKEIQRKI